MCVRRTRIGEIGGGSKERRGKRMERGESEREKEHSEDLIKWKGIGG